MREEDDFLVALGRAPTRVVSRLPPLHSVDCVLADTSHEEAATLMWRVAFPEFGGDLLGEIKLRINCHFFLLQITYSCTNPFISWQLSVQILFSGFLGKLRNFHLINVLRKRLSITDICPFFAGASDDPEQDAACTSIQLMGNSWQDNWLFSQRPDSRWLDPKYNSNRAPVFTESVAMLVPNPASITR